MIESKGRCIPPLFLLLYERWQEAAIFGTFKGISMKRPPKYPYLDHGKRADYRGIEHTLTQREFDALVASPCFYCGQETKGVIDRLDSKRGYISGNCVAACLRCNSRKSCFEHLGVEEAIRRTKELAFRNELPPPSKRPWAKAGISWAASQTADSGAQPPPSGEHGDSLDVIPGQPREG